jgi:hypothetical protein
MRRSAILGLFSAVVLGSAAAAALAEGTTSLRWELGFKNETPAWVRVQTSAESTKISWYMLYTVENKTGAARKPAVRAVLVTDTGKTFGDNLDALTTKAVKKAKDLKDLANANDLRKGIDDGKKVDCIATFGDVDKYAKKIELRVYGLMDPVTMVKGKVVEEIKVWQVKYERKGDEFGRTEDEWKAVSSGWVTEEPETKK